MSEGSDRPPQIESRAPLRPRKPRPSRSRGLRVTTGCVVCRVRHMKCDEARPVCGPCAKSSRECVYGAVSNVTRRNRTLDLSNNSTENTASPEPSQPATSEDREIQKPTPQRQSPVHHQLPTEDVRAERDATISFTDRGRWTKSMEDIQTTSPHSNLSSTSAYPVNVAPLQWFGLLAGDANKADWSSESASPRFSTPSVSSAALPSSSAPYVGESFVNPAAHNHDSSPSAIPQEEVTLTQSEVNLFTHFVKVLSRWIDLTDPHQHFSVMVPHLAMRNKGLMKAILALCARHLSIKQLCTDSELAPDRTLALQYYYETLGYVQQAMKNESYLRSEELLATVLIISTYEMIDGEGQGWERHLKGVFWIQRSREINGESGGLEQAIWWAWIRQDAWAAFRERRKVLSFFKPTKPYHAMDHWDIAARCVYLLAQSINYSSEQETEAGKFDPRARVERADELMQRLEEWYQHLTGHFNPLPCLIESEGPFKPIWIHPPVFALALQMFHCAKVFLLVSTPASGGVEEFMAREQSLNESIDVICGIAMVTTDDAACLSSTQCVYAAGLHVKDPTKRAAVLELLRSHQIHTGWPIQDLRIDLEAEWKKVTTP